MEAEGSFETLVTTWHITSCRNQKLDFQENVKCETHFWLVQVCTCVYQELKYKTLVFYVLSNIF